MGSGHDFIPFLTNLSGAGYSGAVKIRLISTIREDQETLKLFIQDLIPYFKE